MDEKWINCVPVGQASLPYEIAACIAITEYEDELLLLVGSQEEKPRLQVLMSEGLYTSITDVDELESVSIPSPAASFVSFPSRYGFTIVCVTIDGRIFEYALMLVDENGEETLKLQYNGEIDRLLSNGVGVSIHEQGWAVCVGEGGDVKRIHFQEGGDSLQIEKAPAYWVGDIVDAMTYTSEHLVLATAKHEVMVLDKMKTEPKQSFIATRGAPISSIAVANARPNLIAIGKEDGWVELWDLANTQAPMWGSKVGQSNISSLQWQTGRDSTLLVGTATGSVTVLNVESGTEVQANSKTQLNGGVWMIDTSQPMISVITTDASTIHFVRHDVKQ